MVYVMDLLLVDLISSLVIIYAPHHTKKIGLKIVCHCHAQGTPGLCQASFAMTPTVEMYSVVFTDYNL